MCSLIISSPPHTSLIDLTHHITSSLQPQLRGVILVTDFEDQLDLYEYDSEDEDEDFSGDFDMEPYEEEFYGKRGRHDGGGSRGKTAHYFTYYDV